MAAADKQKAQAKPKRPVPPPGKDTLWLVKSGDRVLGPFITAEVVRRLRAKELVVIDEVISPQSRWRHIRDEALFASVVDEIRAGLMTARDDTEVGTGTGTPVIVIRDQGNDDKTPIDQFAKGAVKSGDATVSGATQARFDSTFGSSRISDAEIVSETEERSPNHSATMRQVDKPDKLAGRSVHSTLAYTPPGTASTADHIKIVSRTSRVLWSIVGLAIAIIVSSAYIFKVLPAKRATARAEEITRFKTEADRAWDRAEFVRALKLYEQINREPHIDLETDLRQAILMLRVERETLAAKRRLEDLLPKLQGPEQKTRARVALALAELQSDEPQEAQKQFAQLVREPEAGPIAYFNLACAQAASGLRTEAIQTLAKLSSHPTLEAPSRVLRALLMLKEGASKHAAAVVDVSQPANLAAWRQETYTVGAIADWMDGNKKRSAQRLRLALDTDPMQTEEFYHDPLLYLEPLRWKNILPFVQDYANRVKSNGAKALLGLALIKADRRTEAQSFLAESLKSKMTDGDLQAINAYLMMVLGLDDEARGALRFSRRDEDNESAPIVAVLEARLCERAEDRNCADTVWASLVNRPLPPVVAEVGVARVESQISKEKGVAAVERLKLRYPNSIRVVKLYDDLIDRKGSKP